MSQCFDAEAASLLRLQLVARDLRADAYGKVRRLLSKSRSNRFLVDLLSAAKTGTLAGT